MKKITDLFTLLSDHQLDVDATKCIKGGCCIPPPGRGGDDDDDDKD